MELPILEEKTDVVDEPKIKSVSYSQYTKWLNCPFAWELRYVHGHKEPSNINLIFGTAMHHVIQEWVTILYSGDKLKTRTYDMNGVLKNKMIELAKKELSNEDGTLRVTKEEMAEFYADGCNILEFVRSNAKTLFPSNRKLFAIEHELLIPLESGVNFKGFIDMVLYEKSTKTYYIYDFKTSRRGWFYEKKDVSKTDQLRLYKKFFSETLGVPAPNIVVEFIILKRQLTEGEMAKFDKHVTSFEPSHGSVSVKQTMERFNEFTTTAYQGGQPVGGQRPTPSEKSCKFCFAKDNSSLCSNSWYLTSE